MCTIRDYIWQPCGHQHWQRILIFVMAKWTFYKEISSAKGQKLDSIFVDPRIDFDDSKILSIDDTNHVFQKYI